MRWAGCLLSFVLILLATVAAAGTAFDATTEAGIDKIADAHLPGDAPFVDQTGKQARFDNYFGGPPLVFAAVQYHCPNLCGLTLDGLFGGLAGAGLVAGRDYLVVVMGIDPREGPAEASNTLSKLSGRWAIDQSAVHFLSGSAAAITRASGAMGLRSGWDDEHQQFAHIAAVGLVTPDGRLARWMTGVQFDPRSLRLGLVEAGKGKVGTFKDQVLLLCYGFDPIHGRYGWVVQRLLEVIGSATLGGLGLFVWLATRRERRGT